MLPNERLAYSAIGERPPLGCPTARASPCGSSSTSRNGTSASPCRAPCCPRRRAARRCPTSRTGPGTNTAIASASGACSRCSTSSASRGARHQRLGDRRLRADRPRGARAQLGVHGPRLHPEEHAEGGGRGATTSPAPPRRSREFTGRRPRGWLGPGLTETWETPDLLVEAGYEYVCDWVLDDQPVVLEDARGADRQCALHAGMQRRRDDADPASQGVRISRPRHRPVRAAQSRCPQLRARDGDRRAPLHHGRAASPQILPRRDRAYPRRRRRRVLDRRADPRLVQGRAVRLGMETSKQGRSPPRTTCATHKP